MRFDHHQARLRMVEQQIERRGLNDPAVLGAMRTVARHRFVPDENKELAYRDGPVAIGRGQTISQPYLVALMSHVLGVTEGMRVLEIGTGSGYQSAVLSALGARVFSIEILEQLSEQARRLLDEISAGDISLHVGDGCLGIAEHAPYDGIMVTAAPPRIPPQLLEQLKIGGRMLIPVGERRRQILWKITRTATGFDQEEIIPVLFVPMTGRIHDGVEAE